LAVVAAHADVLTRVVAPGARWPPGAGQVGHNSARLRSGRHVANADRRAVSMHRPGQHGTTWTVQCSANVW